MQEPPDNPWIHIGECPVCSNGLCRVRACCGPLGKSAQGYSSRKAVHLIAVCDECEAMWTEPSTDAAMTFADPETPVCSVCGAPLYGEQSHWALPQDLQGSSWGAKAIFDFASNETRDDGPEG